MSRVEILLSKNMRPDRNDRVANITTIPGLLTPDECQRVIALADNQAHTAATLDDQQAAHASVRKSSVAFLLPGEETSWLYRRLDDVVEQINRDKYGFRLSGFEAVQVAQYEPGGHYDWHMDLGGGEHATRKLSLSIQLTSPAEYTGGGLDFMNVAQETSRELGAGIFFPSFYPHRVIPVEQGLRRSLVAWVHGPSFN